MKNRFNVIQINGIKGILFLAGAAICLFAGFVVFPGIVMKLAWNFFAGMTNFLPSISVLQGVLLWGITVVTYLTFKKKGFFVEFKTTQELSGEELNAVMQKIRMERRSDLIAHSIMRAREFEERAKTQLDCFEKNSNDSSNLSQKTEDIEDKTTDKFVS